MIWKALGGSYYPIQENEVYGELCRLRTNSADNFSVNCMRVIEVPFDRN